jgi:photosystem II stability/assembly factor-like uncharacterized protein
MKKLAVIIFLCFYPFYQFSPQELNWNHTGGPMGGIIGGMDITSDGDIYTGMYPFMIGYTGLYKSTDSGDSWKKIETQFEAFEVFSVYVSKDNHIWVGTDHQGRLYRSTDKGQTWENKNTGYNVNECWAIGESNDGVLIAGDANAGRLYRSTDNGENWEFSANIASLAFAVDSNNVVYAGSFNGLYSSTDNGLTWTQDNFLSSCAVSTVVIDSDNNIYCGTGVSFISGSGNGVFFSDDGGQNWRQLGLAGKVVLSLAFDSQWNLFAGTLKDGLYKTSDLGQNWIQHQNGIYRKEIFRLVINQQDDIFIGSEGGGSGWFLYGGGGVFRSTDGGDSFEQVGLPISMVRNMVFSGDSLIITSTPSGVQKYNRFINKWQNLGLHNVEAVTISPANHLYAATRDEGLYKSTDLGSNWFITNLTVDTLLPVYNVLAINDDTVFVITGVDNKLRRSIDGGQNWEILSLRVGSSSRGLFISDTNLWVTGVSSGSAVLYKSENFGTTFDSLYSGFGTGESNNPIYSTSYGYVYLASLNDSFEGIFRSTTNGLSWEQVLFGKKCATVYADNDGLVLSGSLATSNSDTNKVFLSTNFGDDWTNFSQPTEFGIYITDIKKDLKNNFFWGTSGEGLFKVDILTSVKGKSLSDYKLYLSQNYPNPFNPNTKISYSITKDGLVTLKVYDILGNEVAILVNEEKPAGIFEVEFDGTGFTSGIYFYRLKAGDYLETKKMILLK